MTEDARYVVAWKAQHSLKVPGDGGTQTLNATQLKRDKETCLLFTFDFLFLPS